MPDASEKKESIGFDIAYNKICEVGKEVFQEYGCNLVVVLIDKKANDGRSKIGKIYESPGVNGFCQTRVSGGEDALVQHFKSYLPRHMEPSTSSTNAMVQRDAGNPEKKKNSDDDSPSTKSWKKDRSPYIRALKSAIFLEAVGIGLPLQGPRFPWKTLPKLCAQHGMYIDNFPDGVRSPLCKQDRLECNNSRNGIGQLHSFEHLAILHALTEEKVHPMRFMKMNNPSRMQNNKFPAIIYAPPPRESHDRRSKRYFLDGSYDYHGHPRLTENGADLKPKVQKRGRRANGGQKTLPDQTKRQAEDSLLIQRPAKKIRKTKESPDTLSVSPSAEVAVGENVLADSSLPNGNMHPEEASEGEAARLLSHVQGFSMSEPTEGTPTIPLEDDSTRRVRDLVWSFVSSFQ